MRIAVVVAVLLSLQIAGGAQAPVGVQEPAWAPDGRRIAVSYLDRIWTMTPDGRQGKAVTAGDGSAIEREPVWAPDGNRLAYAADRGDGFDILVVTLRNAVAVGTPVAVTTLPGDERWPSAVHDGHRSSPGNVVTATGVPTATAFLSVTTRMTKPSPRSAA